jgi:hypothetical protein
MVRKGSPVRVRQRAPTKAPLSGVFLCLGARLAASKCFLGRFWAAYDS